MRRILRRCSVETGTTMIASHFRMAALYHNIVADNAANTHILGRSVERNGTTDGA